MIIQVQDLCKDFTEKTKIEGKKITHVVRAVNNINFAVNEGETIAFIGPNGAGKSTTIKMLTGIIQPTSGKITVNGLNPSEDRKKLAYNISCMFGQKSQLYMHLEVIESFKLLGYIYDMEKSDVESRIDYLSHLFGIEQLLRRKVRKLSLGQRMICEMAASIIHRPKILFLDEPTIGLDVVVKLRIREIIKKLNEEEKTTIFLTSHDVGDVDALCDRIVIINQGEVVKDCNMQELKQEHFTTKYVTIFYAQPITCSSFNYDVYEKTHNKVKLKVDTKTIKIGDVLSYFYSLGEVEDIKIEHISMEEIIRNIYEKVIK